MFTVELVWGAPLSRNFSIMSYLVSLLQGHGMKDKSNHWQQPAERSGHGTVLTYIDTEGSLPGESNRSRVLVCGGSRDPNHDAVMRIKSKAPGRRAHSV
jgi:hypothetical protein